MSKQNAHDLASQDLRASLSTPHLSVMKESTEGTSNSFWFAERRKPRSRLLSAFPFRKSSKMFDHENPPSIANTPEIPWSVPGIMSEEDDDNNGNTVHPSISNSLLSFRVFNNLRKNNSYLPPTPSNSQDPFPVIEASYSNGTTENANTKNGVRNILRFPFGGRRSPVPSATRKEAIAAEDGFEKQVAEKNERPSDISLNIPHMDDEESSFKNIIDPHDFDVDEYSSLHSAISAMLTEKSHVVARNDEDEMLTRHDIKLKRPMSRGVLFEEEVPQIRAGVVRYKSTPRENPSACAFSGPVLAFSLLPSRPIEVPPAPLVYGPETTGWPHAFSDFSDPHGTTIGSISLVNENPTNVAAELSDKTVTPPETPVLNLRTSKSPSDEALVPGNMSYVRVSSIGMVSNASEKRLDALDFSFDPVTRVRSGITLEASYSIPMRSTNESFEDQGGSHAGLSNQISIPRQSPPVHHTTPESDAYPVAILMDESQEISAHKPNPHLFAAPTPAADSLNLLVAPTLADVQKFAAETRRKSELQNVLLNSLRPSALPDVVPLADIRSNDDSSLHIPGAIPAGSEPTFTTFSETSRDWGGSLEFASDVPSLSSNEMFVDAPSNLFRSSRNAIERLELPHPAELGSPPSQASALKSPLLSTVIQKSKIQDRPSRLSKVGIVGPSPWREPKPVPRANTATVLSTLPVRPLYDLPTLITTSKHADPAIGTPETDSIAPVASKSIAYESIDPVASKSIVSERTVAPTEPKTVADEIKGAVASKPAVSRFILKPFILGTPPPVVTEMVNGLTKPDGTGRLAKAVAMGNESDDEYVTAASTTEELESRGDTNVGMSGAGMDER